MELTDKTKLTLKSLSFGLSANYVAEPSSVWLDQTDEEVDVTCEVLVSDSKSYDLGRADYMAVREACSNRSLWSLRGDRVFTQVAYDREAGTYGSVTFTFSPFISRLTVTWLVGFPEG